MVFLPPSNPSGTLLLGLAQWGKQGSSIKLSCSRFSDRVDFIFPTRSCPAATHTHARTHARTRARQRSAWGNGSRSAATSVTLSPHSSQALPFNDSLDSLRTTHWAQCPALADSSLPAQKEILISKAAQRAATPDLPRGFSHLFDSHGSPAL